MNSPFSDALPESWKFLSLSEILQLPEQTEPPWRIKGLAAAGCGTQVSSQPHGMKSYSWLQAMIEASLGLPIWSHFEPCGVRNTLFMETEDPQWMVVQRTKMIATGLGIEYGEATDRCQFTMGHLGPFDLVQCRDQMKRTLDHYKPDVAVLSTLQGLLGARDWKEQSEMAEVNALLVQLSQEYCPMVVITHSPQDKKQKRAAGTITQAANFQNILHYEKITHGVKVRLDSKLGDPEQFRLKIINGQPDRIRFQYAMMTDPENLKDYIATHPEESSAQIAEKFDCSKRWINSLKNSGK